MDEDDDFWVLQETEGLNTAMAYTVGKNCIDAMLAEGQLDWLSELLDYAEDTLGLDALAAEAGAEKS